MPRYKLIYFNTTVRAEVARMLFALAGVGYEDYRVNGAEEWFVMKSGEFNIVIEREEILWYKNWWTCFVTDGDKLSTRKDWLSQRCLSVKKKEHRLMRICVNNLKPFSRVFYSLANLSCVFLGIGIGIRRQRNLFSATMNRFINTYIF